MVFSSVIFLFLFLPIVLGCYYLLPGRQAKNLWLVAASLLFYAFNHRQAARFALHQPGAGIKIFRPQVGHLRMAVCNDHLRCASRERPLNRGIHFLFHQTTGQLIFRVAGCALLRTHNARDTFNIGRNKNFHVVNLSRI